MFSKFGRKPRIRSEFYRIRAGFLNLAKTGSSSPRVAHGRRLWALTMVLKSSFVIWNLLINMENKLYQASKFEFKYFLFLVCFYCSSKKSCRIFIVIKWTRLLGNTVAWFITREKLSVFKLVSTKVNQNIVVVFCK